MAQPTVSSGSPPLAALFTPRFVPPTQTFIYEETCHYHRYAAEVFARYRMNEEQFPFAPVHALASESGPRSSFESFLYQNTTVSPTFLRLLSTGRYTIIHGLFGRSAVNALPYHYAAGLPLIVTFRGADAAVLAGPARHAPANVPYWVLSKLLFKRAGRLLTVSEDLAGRLLAAGADSKKVHVWHSGIVIPPHERRNTRNKTVILTVGRFVEKKGIEYAIEAFARLARERPDVELRLIGDGPPRTRYEELARTSGVGDRIVFLGTVPHPVLRAELSAADILFAPSVAARDDAEGVPTVMMEASAREVPIVASRVGGIPDIVEEGKTGLLVAERDVSGFVDALRALTIDARCRRAMGEAGRDKMGREHNLDDRMAVLEAHYDEVIGEYRAAARRKA
jgi:glycosyltransferase involved in cell wall biosynthesis